MNLISHACATNCINSRESVTFSEHFRRLESSCRVRKLYRESPHPILIVVWEFSEQFKLNDNSSRTCKFFNLVEGEGTTYYCTLCFSRSSHSEVRGDEEKRVSRVKRENTYNRDQRVHILWSYFPFEKAYRGKLERISHDTLGGSLISLRSGPRHFSLLIQGAFCEKSWNGRCKKI